jgi:sulfur-oxidizing protein SoxY
MKHPSVLQMSTRLGVALAFGLFITGSARAEDDAAARLERWHDLRQSIFGDRTVANGDDKIAIEAPDRAMDAALVPVTITVKAPHDVKSIYLMIDDNPAPLAAHVSFGPAGDARKLKFRVRIDQYTLMHAVEETKAGELFETSRFIKAAGGCSAPAGSYDDAAFSQIGQMKLRVQSDTANGTPREVQLLIRHPNFNGMQMDPDTRGFTPARFLKTTEIAFNGQEVLRLDSDISLATDPAISFSLNGHEKGTLDVKARDSDDKLFEQHFDIAKEGS